MPPPPLLWVTPASTGQEQGRSLEMPKGKTASESPLKEQDLMVSMNQVLPPSMVEIGNSRSPLMDTSKADHPKNQDF